MKPLLLLAFALATSACVSAQVTPPAAEPAVAAEAVVTVVPVSDVAWSPLNPARGDASPRAGTLWGDRTGPGATGFLVEFADGFSSPPHIHNVTYRGVVLSGLVHNDDPDAELMWLPPGSFWTQPAGDVHITAAEGTYNLAYIEIDEGPYLVQPTDEAFDSGEVEVNVDASNVVWLDASDLAWVEATPSAGGPEVAVLWDEAGQQSGALVKLPAGSASMVRSRGATLRAVVVQGQLAYQAPGTTGATVLEPGSFVGSEGTVAHPFACGPEAECLVYVRSERGFDLTPAQPAD